MAKSERINDEQMLFEYQHVTLDISMSMPLHVYEGNHICTKLLLLLLGTSAVVPGCGSMVTY